MTIPSTPAVDSLLYAADVLHGLPGLAPVYVAVTPTGGVTFNVTTAYDATEHARGVAVDMLCAVLGLHPEPYQIDGETWYGSRGQVGGRLVDVFAPICDVVRPEVPA